MNKNHGMAKFFVNFFVTSFCRFHFQMASKQETVFDDDDDSIYENVADVTTRHKNVAEKTNRRGSDTDETERRGSSSADESSGAGSFNWADERRPPVPPLKLRIPSSESRVKYSYDEVSVNFGKPVILRQPDKIKLDNEEDIFGSVTFQSPIQDLSVEEKEILFKASRPVPAPRPSKTQRPKEKIEKEDEVEIDDKIYEDPDDLKSEISTLDRISKHPPQVPMRNVLIPENRPKSLTSKTNSYENVYCEIRPFPTSDKSQSSVENIMDRKEGQVADEDDDIPNRLGARPRNKRLLVLSVFN